MESVTGRYWNSHGTGISRGACSRINRDHLCFETGALLSRSRCQKIHSLDDGLLADLHRYLREARPLLVKENTPALFLDRYGNRLSTRAIDQLINALTHSLISNPKIESLLLVALLKIVLSVLLC